VVIFPVIAAVVSGVFAAILLRRYAARSRNLALLAWGIALSMYAFASLVVAFGVSQGWEPSLYRIYWLFGAVLNVPYLALGSIALIGNRVLTAIAVLLVAAGTLFALGVVFSSKTNRNAFVRQHEVNRQACPSNPVLPLQDTYDIPRGKCVWKPGSAVGKLGSAYSIPAYFVVVAIALWTSRPRRGRTPEPNRARGNWLIAGGATIVAVGGTAIARLGRGAPFSIALALGVVVMFVGFIWSSRQPAGAPAPGSSGPAPRSAEGHA
jgi:hypothetical protein